ncbi:MAG: ATPase, partial [Oscillospiraceae bacterium]
VVFSLSDLVGGAGSIPVIIIGNIFVVAVEGLIVGIQVLRLEFFEIFSRFYGGEGRTFTPVKLKKEDN